MDWDSFDGKQEQPDKIGCITNSNALGLDNLQGAILVCRAHLPRVQMEDGGGVDAHRLYSIVHCTSRCTWVAVYELHLLTCRSRSFQNILIWISSLGILNRNLLIVFSLEQWQDVQPVSLSRNEYRSFTTYPCTISKLYNHSTW